MRIRSQPKQCQLLLKFAFIQTATLLLKAFNMTDLTPREIVSELDRFIIGQNDAKRAVSVALRSRWRRKQLPADLQDEVYPKNILMIGPTGVGKTEISRRLAKLANAPFHQGRGHKIHRGWLCRP